MIHLQDFIESNKPFKTIKVDDLLFAEFKCPCDETSTAVWCTSNYLSYIYSGEMMLKTPRNELHLKAGDCVFVKKGSVLLEIEKQKDFREVLVFVPDGFIRSTLRKLKIQLVTQTKPTDYIHAFPFGSSEVVRSYFLSLYDSFNKPEPPPGALLKLKFEELILTILSNPKYLPLKSYFSEISRSSNPSIKEIMENNFTYNLTLQEFARLCGRSLSSFNTEFKNIYQTTPGRWILKMRLEYSRYLIDLSGYTFDEICTMSGFDKKSHFYKVFKKVYGVTPATYRMREKPALE